MITTNCCPFSSRTCATLMRTEIGALNEMQGKYHITFVHLFMHFRFFLGMSIVRFLFTVIIFIIISQLRFTWAVGAVQTPPNPRPATS